MNSSRVMLGLCAAIVCCAPPAWAQKGAPPMTAYAVPEWSASPASDQVAVPPPPAPVYTAMQEEIIVPQGVPDGAQPYWNGPDGTFDGYDPSCEGMPVYTENCPQLRHVLGIEWLFLQPLNEPKQRVTLTDLIAERSHTSSPEPEMDDGFRIWWGMEYGWLGYRLRYSHLGNDSVAGDPVVGPNSNRAFHSSYQLDADIFDFEMTQWFCCHQHVVDMSIGARYAQLERGGTVIGYGDEGNVQLFGVATAGNDLEGAGVTFSIGTISPVHGCWNCFWNFRGSYLWADQSASVLTKANAVVQPPIGAGVADSEDSAFIKSDDSEGVWIGEFQIGLQYQQALCAVPANFYFRIALEYQYWDTGDLFAASNSFAFLEGGPPEFGGAVESTAHAHDGNLDLLGLTLGAGISF